MPDTAVILAAGRGSGVFPYDSTSPKAALPVGDEPLVRRQVGILRGAGVERIVVVIGHLGDQVRRTLRGEEGVVFVRQDRPTGTADAVLLALDKLDAEEPRELIVVYGDVLLWEEEFRELLAAFEGHGDAVAVAACGDVVEGTEGQVIGLSVGGKRIRRCTIQSGAGKRFAGCLACRGEFLPYLESCGGFRGRDSLPVGGMPPRERELASAFNAAISDGEEIIGVDTGEAFVDIDRPWDLLRANHLLCSREVGSLDRDRIHPGAAIDDSARIAGHVEMGENSRIGPGVIIQGNIRLRENSTVTDGAIVGNNCIIGREASVYNTCEVGGNSVIGAGSKVGHTAEFSGVMMEGVYLVHYCELSGIIGTRTDIGAATVCGTLRFDSGRTEHRRGHFRERPKYGSNATYIGEYCRTGVNVIFMPGARVGAHSCIGPGAIVQGDVEENTLLLVQQEQVEKYWGPERYGW